MKYFLIFILTVCSIAHARPPKGELPSNKEREAAIAEYRYRVAYASCYSAMTPYYCMALTLLEKEFCKKSELGDVASCERQVLEQRYKAGLE